MPALSPVKNEKAEWVQKKLRLQKREDCVHGSATKIIETYRYSEIFFS
jgi:hypothetical protein